MFHCNEILHWWLPGCNITKKMFYNINTFLFLISSKLLLIRAKIHKMFARIANRGDTVKKQSNLCLGCLFSRQLDLVFEIVEYLP